MTHERSPHYPRRGPYPVPVPELPDGRCIRLAIVYAVCYRFRVPVFRRLSEHPALNVKLFVGSGIEGTKTVNAKDTSGLELVKMWTLKRMVRSSGRLVPLLFSPFVAWHLWRWKPDVLLIQGSEPLTNFLLLAYAKLFRKPVIWWSLGELRGRSFRGLGVYFRRLVSALERRCDFYLGYSSVAVDYFLRMGYPADRCYNLVNVVDTDLIARNMQEARPRVEPLRRSLGVEGRRVLLFVGALEETKRVDRLLQAYADLSAESAFRDTRLVLVGDGSQRTRLEDLATELGLKGRAMFVGPIFHEVSAYFQLADLLVLPGTGGLAISEAMAHGLPVVCSTGDGCELDLVRDGENGFVVADDDVGMLTATLRKCLSSKDTIDAMGRASKRAIDDQYNISRYMNELLSAIFAAYRQVRPSHGVNRS